MCSAYGVHAQPSSMLAMRTFGKRPNRLPSTSATVSSRMPRSDVMRLRERGVVAGVGQRLAPHLVERLAVLRDVRRSRGTRRAALLSFSSDQNRSHDGSAGDRPLAGPGRIDTTLMPLFKQELELVGGEVGVEHRDVGRRVQAVLVRVAPVLLEPQVERVEHLVGHRHVVVHEALDAVAERREEDALLDVLLVDHVDACVVDAVAVGELLELAVRALHLGERDAGDAVAALLQLLQPSRGTRPASRSG